MRFGFAKSLAVSLALCAMVLRAVLPDGWMPAAGASFVICAVDGHHGGKAPAQAPRSHAPCAFAAAPPLSPPAGFAAALGTPQRAIRLAAVFADEDFLADPDHRPHAARAPPAFS